MKRLSHFGIPLEFVFNGADDLIAGWVSKNLDKFLLNEEHSCTVHLAGDSIIITGDEDRIELLIEKQEIIQLSRQN